MITFQIIILAMFTVAALVMLLIPAYLRLTDQETENDIPYARYALLLLALGLLGTFGFPVLVGGPNELFEAIAG